MKKYLLLLPLLFAISSLFFFRAAYDEIVHEKTQQKFNSVIAATDRIEKVIRGAGPLDETQEFGIIKVAIEDIDAQYMIFASAYDQELILLTTRYPEDIQTPFDPRLNIEFLKDVYNNPSGELIITQSNIDFHTHYLWIDNRYLIVCAVNNRSIDQNFAAWIGWGTAIVIGSLIVIQILMVWHTMFSAGRKK